MAKIDSPSTDSDTGTVTHPIAGVNLNSLSRTTLRHWIQPLFAVSTLVALVAVSVYAIHESTVDMTLGGREVAVLDVLYGLALVFVAVVVTPTAVSLLRKIRRLPGFVRERPLLGVCGGYVFVLFFVGSVYPFYASETVVRPLISLQPPFWGSVPEQFISTCHGPVVGESCQGTLEFPLGTTIGGKDILKVTLLGLNTSLQVAATASVLAVTMGVAAGTVAGYVGGLVDEFLMRYVDLQRSLPSFFLYILLSVMFGVSYPLMVLIFGLFSWGGIARQVRGEVLQRKADPFVKAARLSGARPRFIIRRHILPNTTNTIVTATTVLLGKFIVYEASLAFLTLSETDIPSLGTQLTAAVGKKSADITMSAAGAAYDWWLVPWVVIVPAALLCSLLLAVGVLSDGLRDELDPRE